MRNFGSPAGLDYKCWDFEQINGVFVGALRKRPRLDFAPTNGFPSVGELRKLPLFDSEQTHVGEMNIE